MSLAAAAQWTAVATAVLAVFAIVTAVFAFLAFRKQSAEVATLQQQFDDQRKVNKLQARELQESLAQRKREADERHRAQASRVFIWVALDPAYSDPIATAHLKNSSDQPIYDLDISWRPGGSREFDQPLMPGEELTDRIPVPDGADPAWYSADAYFRDATGTSWRARPDGIVEEVPPGKDPPHPL